MKWLYPMLSIGILFEQLVNFFDAALMAATFEVGGDEHVDYAEGCFFGDEAGGHGDHVGVVVLTCELSYFGCPAECATNIGVLVGCDLNAVAAAADDDAAIEGMIVDYACCLMGEIGIIDAFGTICTIVFDLETFGLEVAYYFDFEFVAGVVASDCNDFFHVGCRYY